jgi:hypothetical protein
VIPSPTISRVHASIELQHPRYILSDAGSSNGTYLNGQRSEEPAQHSTNDEIWFGSSAIALVFTDPKETVDVALHSDLPPLHIVTGARITRIYGAPVPLTMLEYELLLSWPRVHVTSVPAKYALPPSGTSPTTTRPAKTRSTPAWPAYAAICVPLPRASRVSRPSSQLSGESASASTLMLTWPSRMSRA